MNRGIVRRITIALVFLLVVTGNAGIARALADATVGLRYVSDVMAFQGVTIEECAKDCEDLGYTPVRYNLNKGAKEKVPFISDNEGPCVILGYKTTDNRNLAITDISLLHMGEGYEIKDFRAVAAALLAKNHAYAEGLAAAASQFADNYDKQAPAAVNAYKTLDLLYVNELERHSIESHCDAESLKSGARKATDQEKADIKQALEARDEGISYKEGDHSDHVPLSQYIIDGNADVEFFGELLSFGTPSIVNAIDIALCRGSAEYENYFNSETQDFETRTWAEQLRHGDAKSLIEGGLTVDEWRRFDGAYLDAARDIASSIQSFTTLYLNARARGASATSLPVSSATGTDDLEQIEQEVHDLGDADADFIYVAAYERLNKYHYDEQTLLGDYIVKMGQRAYATTQELRDLYPLADVISPTQIILMKYCGFATFVNTMEQPDAPSGKVDEAMAELAETMRGFTEAGEEWRLSVWCGVDSSVYNGKVAMTSDAIRIDGANAVLALTAEEKAALKRRRLNLIISLAGGILDLLAGIAGIALLIREACVAATAAATAALTGLWGAISMFTKVAGLIGLVVLLIELAIAIVTAVYRYIRNELHDPSSEYTEMPTVLYETTGVREVSRVVKYNAVLEPLAARVADVNGYVGYKWNCLFATHDPDAGSPLVVTEGAEPFKMKENDELTPQGYRPVAIFGQKDAADLNYGAYEVTDGQKNFLFVTTEESVARLEGATGEAEVPQKGLFVSDIVVETADTVERARAKIISRKGKLYLVDRNLGTAEAPVYMGYSLTKDPSLAVTDIRVMAACDPGQASVNYGTATYRRAGAMANGDAVFFTKDRQCGTPIHSGFSFVKKSEEVKEGFEPVVYASGAPMYLFGEGDERVAMYFEPSEKFTGGESYVMGIGFVTSTRVEETQSYFREYDDDMAKALAWQRWPGMTYAQDLTAYYGGGASGAVPPVTGTDDPNLSGALCVMSGVRGSRWGVGFNNRLAYRTQMVYALTHNPYRAIRDVGLYSGCPDNRLQLHASLTKAITTRAGGVERTVSAGYVACENVFTEDGRTLGKSSSSFGTHAYLPLAASDMTSLSNALMKPLDDGSPGSWEFSTMRFRGMYVLGPVDGLSPLKASDLVISRTATDSVLTDTEVGCDLPQASYTLAGTDASGSAFHSVQDLRYPFNLRAQNLSMPQTYSSIGDAYNYDEDDSYDRAPDEVYLYVRGTVHRPRYISSVTVGAYDPDEMRASGDYDKDTIKKLDTMGDDIACRAALSGAAAELVPQNLAVKKDDAWYNKKNDDGVSDAKHEYKCAYLAVSRTDDISKAARGLLLVSKPVAQPQSAAISQIAVKGETTYYVAQGSAPIPVSDGYYLYYSYNPAALPGAPITDICVDDEPYWPQMLTVTMTKEIGRDAKLAPDGTVPAFIHCSYQRDNGHYINAFYIGVGQNLQEALLDAFGQGCTEAVVANLNEGGTKAVAIAMRTTAVDEAGLKAHRANVGTIADPLVEVVRDLIVTVGEPLRTEIVVDGVAYRPCRSKETMSIGLGTDDVYLYEASDFYAIQHNKDTGERLVMPSLRQAYASPIMKVGFGVGERVPYNTMVDGTAAGQLECWENVLTPEGKRADLNAGVIQRVNDAKQLKDNRLYMFCHREDNSVKPGAEICGGTVATTIDVGTLVGVNE